MCDNPITSDVWFVFTVPSSGSVSLRTNDIDLSNGVADFGAEFYSSCSTNADAIACVQNSFSLGSSSYMPGEDDIDLSGYEGNTVYLRLFDYGSTIPSGSFEICLFDSSSENSSHDFYTSNLVTDNTSYNLGDAIDIDVDQGTNNPSGEAVSVELQYTLRDSNGNVLEVLGDDTSTLGDDDQEDGEGIFATPTSSNLPSNCQVCAEANYDGAIPENNTSNNLSCVNINIQTLSVDSFNIKSNVKLFPNPTKDEINIAISSNTIVLEKLEVYSIIGVKVIELKTNLDKINLQHLNSGTYFLKIYYVEKRSAIFKIIKQ